MNATEKRYGTALRLYDNGGRSLDRYTIIPPRWASEYRGGGGGWDAVMSGDDPRGMSGWCEAMPGRHLGRRIAWSDLPSEVQRFARYAFPEYAPTADES